MLSDLFLPNFCLNYRYYWRWGSIALAAGNSSSGSSSIAPPRPSLPDMMLC